MTSPVERIRVECPECGTVYDDWYRASINFDLGEDFDEEYVREATTTTCPKCGHVVHLASLTIEGGVWRWGHRDRSTPLLTPKELAELSDSR